MDTKVDTREFPFATVLSVVHKQIFDKKDNVILLLKFMTGKSKIEDSEVSNLMSFCKPKLVELFSKLDTPIIKGDINNLNTLLDCNNNQGASNSLIKTWLNELITSTGYGDMLKVPSISKTIWESERQEALLRLQQIKSKLNWT